MMSRMFWAPATVPAGFSQSGLPIRLHIAGRKFEAAQEGAQLRPGSDNGFDCR